jgi:hypothetical protein
MSPSPPTHGHHKIKEERNAHFASKGDISSNQSSGKPLLTGTFKQAASKPSAADSKKPNVGSGWGALAANAKNAAKSAPPVPKDTFAAFKKQAKEKEDKMKQLHEQQEQRRIQRERAEQERLRQERERMAIKEEEDALDKVRRQQLQSEDLLRQQEPLSASGSSPSTGSASPAQSVSERERQRLREQERRRREAMAGQIDMNRQSDIMASFEYENNVL